MPGTLAHEIYGNDASPSATAIATRSTTTTSTQLRSAGLRDLGAHASASDLTEMVELPHASRGSSAASSTRSSRRRRATAIRCSSASCRPRSSTRRARRAATRASRRRAGRVGMKLCGFDVGLDQPFFLIAGPCVVESRAAADRRRRAAEGDLRARSAFRSSSSRRTTRPTAARHASFRGPGHGGGPARSSPRCEAQLGVPVLTDVHDDDADRRSRRGGRRAADAGVPVPPDRLHPAPSRAAGKPVNIKKGQFLAPEDMKHVVDKAQGGERRRQHHGLRARRVVRLQQPRLRHALARDHARDRLPGRVRRHALGAAAGRPGHVVAAASASSCRCWRARRSRPASPASSWKRIPTGQGAVRRPERVAARAHARAARDACCSSTA